MLGPNSSNFLLKQRIFMDSSLYFRLENANNYVPRHLPTYEAVIMPYSLRLPAYRSSYIRRFHPYARFVAPPMEDYCLDYAERDEETPLDLSIIEEPPPPLSAAPVNDVHDIGDRDNENRTEEVPELDERPCFIVGPDTIGLGLEEQHEQVEGGGAMGPFLRIDAITAMQTLGD